ncbi:hypothetical protein [Pseudomonas phage Rollin]|nr:hypothetical protein [Pseudomonas phage Rollin]
MSGPITLTAEGYDELAIILRDAFKQASEGKGAERHANSKPFHEQPMQTVSDLFDSDKGMAFQIVKKLREGLDMPEYERLERELLGVIVYTAGAILWHKRRHVAENVSLVAAVEPPVTFKERCAEIDAEIQAAALAQPVDIYAQAAAHIDETPPQPRVVGMNPNLVALYDTTVAVESDAEMHEPALQPVDPFADAPEWAKYKAQDADGDWYWYEKRPEQCAGLWSANNGTHKRAQRSHAIAPAWRDTLIERPTK